MFSKTHPVKFVLTIFVGAILSVGMPWVGQDACAEGPQVSFDVPPVVACHDVSTEEFVIDNPSERLVEARLRVSAMLVRGSERDLTELAYRFESRLRAERIEDFYPKTAMASQYASGIGVEKRRETAKTFGLNVTGKVGSVQVGPISGGTNWSNKDHSNIKYELVPPMETITSSGTVSRGYGAYFKHRPNRQGIFEGDREFTLVLRVPRDWRGGLMYTACAAIGKRRSVVGVLDEQAVSGPQRFLIALHFAGDEDAKRTAIKFSRSEVQLRELVVQSAKKIERHKYPSFAHRIGAAFDVVDSKIPNGWLDGVLLGLPAETAGSFQSHLPADVRQATESYLLAKRDLAALSGL